MKALVQDVSSSEASLAHAPRWLIYPRSPCALDALVCYRIPSARQLPALYLIGGERRIAYPQWVDTDRLGRRVLKTDRKRSLDSYNCRYCGLVPLAGLQCLRRFHQIDPNFSEVVVHHRRGSAAGAHDRIFCARRGRVFCARRMDFLRTPDMSHPRDRRCRRIVAR